MCKSVIGWAFKILSDGVFFKQKMESADDKLNGVAKSFKIEGE